MRISDWSSDVCSSDLLGWNSYYIDEWPVQKAGLAPDQIQITGSMQLDASKCGLRFMDVYVAQPYPHELKLTIEATSEQDDDILRSEEHTSELQSLMLISYAVFCLKKKHPLHSLHQYAHLNTHSAFKHTTYT